MIWLLVGSILLQYTSHELAHVLTQKAFHGSIKKIGLGLLGPYVVRERLTENWQNAAVALAGPVTNFILWFILMSYNVHYAYLGLFLFIVEMLPIKAADGYKAVQYLKGNYA